MSVETFTHCSPSHSQELLDKLNALRSEDLFCDVSIRVQGQLFSAHKVVLACCSDFLRAKLSGKPAEEDAVIVGEDNRHVLDLQHATVAGFAPLLEYAYTSTLSISTKNIIDVLSMASYLQMFAVANTCTELMKSSILWSSGSSGAGGPGSTQPPGLHRPQEPPEGHASCALAPEDALSPPPVSPECSVPERPIPVCRESKRKRKGFASPQPEFSTSPQVPNPSPSSSSFPETSAQALEPSLVFSWTYPFGVDRQFTPEKSKLPEGLLEPSGAPGQGSSGRALVEHLACEGPRGLGEAGVEQEEEDDVQMKVQRLSADEEHEEASQPVSSLSDQQTGPGSGDPLISPQSSSSDRPQHYPFAVKCPVCPAWIANISRHLRAVHDMGNMEQRTLLINYARRRVRLSSLDCPLCGIMVKYPEKHLERGHKDLTESARSKVVRSLGRSVTVGKLRILWNSNPSIPMVHDFSQDEAPPDARQTDRRETSPLRCRRRV